MAEKNNALNPFCELGDLPNSYIWDDQQSDATAQFLFNYKAVFNKECKNKDIINKLLIVKNI